jgi:hypothetical protein
MLPNLTFLLGGILFCVLLFAAAGAGVTLPESRTHVGEMPEVGRPMLQQSMAEAPPRTAVYMMMVSRRGDEPEQLREPTAREMAAAPSRRDPPPSDIVKDGSTDAAKSDAVVTAEPPAAPPAAADAAPFVAVPLPPSRGTMPKGGRHGQRVADRGYSVVQHHRTAPGADGEGPAGR